MIFWRLHIGRGLIQWHGPSHTYTLWPYLRREERTNL